jgi:CHAD domain-containing protein
MAFPIEEEPMATLGRIPPAKRAERALVRAARDRSAQVAVGVLAAAGAAVAATKAAVERGGDDAAASSGPSRTYRLKRNEPPTAGMRRIAAGRADDALDQLRGKGEHDFAGAVHEARKDLKKLRSVLRLVRADLGDEVYRRENDRFRDAGRLLSRARDAQVKLETLASLRERHGGQLADERLAPYEDALVEERDREANPDDDGGTVPRTVAEIEAGRAAVADWPLEADDWWLVGPGLERAYRRGRARFADVRAEASAENVHEWRKRVKDLWYHLRIVCKSWREVLDETADQAHELSDLLGDHHDLAVLRGDALERRELLAPDDLDELLGAIDERQRELAGEAIRLGHRLYAEKPKAFARRMRSYWEAWR